MTYNITDLRADLAGTIKALREGDEKMTVDKAKAVSELAGRMIDSAKVEVDMLRTIGRGRMKPTGFVPLEHQDTLDEQEGGRASLPAPPAPQLEGPKRKHHVYNPVGTAPRGSL